MKEIPKYFIISSVCGGVLGLFVYTIIISVNDYDYSNGHAIASLILGVVIGFFLIKFLNLRHYWLYTNERFRSWMFFYIEANLFFGILTGFFLGILVSWLLMFPFSLLFGHPEGGWSPFVNNLYKILILILGLFCVVASTYYLLRGSILYVEKKTGSSDKKISQSRSENTRGES